MPYINRQNDVILADREWLQQKRYAGHWTAAERARLKGLLRQYNVSWRGDTRHVPWNTLLERVDIIRPTWWQRWLRRKAAGVHQSWRV